MSKKSVQRQAFKTKEYVVYPAHGVGQVIGIEEQEIAGLKLERFLVLNGLRPGEPVKPGDKVKIIAD